MNNMAMNQPPQPDPWQFTEQDKKIPIGPTDI